MISSNIILIFVAFTVALIAIYTLYSILLFKGISTGKGDDLQLSTKNILEQVEVLYNKQEYALVELLASKYLDRVPDHIEVRKYLAKAYLEDKKFNFAMKHCAIILQKRPNDIDSHYVLGKCYIKKRMLSKAIAALYFVYERNKKDREVVKLLAELYVQTDQLHYAIEAYKELVDLTESPEDAADLQSIIAELDIEVKNYPEAFEAYKARLAVFPRDVDTNQKLTELYIEIGNYPLAIETLLLMLSFVNEPKTLLWVYETLIDLYERTQDFEKAIAYSEKLLDVQGSDKFKIRDRIAAFYIQLGDYEHGILILEDLAMMSQNGFEVTLELAEAYINKGLYQEALDRYKLLLDKATQKEAKIVNTLICDLYIKWSEVLQKDEDYANVMEMLNSALQYNPISSDAFYHIALCNFEQKNYTNTVEFINKALSYNKEESNQSKYLLTLSAAHHELGNFFEEKKALSDLLSIDEKNAEGLYRVGLMYAAQRDIKNAEDAFKKAVEYDPEMVQAKYNLALIYENNNKDKAKELYMEVLEQDPTFVEAKNALTDLSGSDAF